MARKGLTFPSNPCEPKEKPLYTNLIIPKITKKKQQEDLNSLICLAYVAHSARPIGAHVA